MMLFAIANHLSSNISGNMAFVILGLSAVSVFAWQRRDSSNAALIAAATILLFGAADLLMLGALPRLGLSFGPTRLSLIWITALRAAVWILLLIVARAGAWRSAARRLAASRPTRAARDFNNRSGFGITMLWAAYLVISALALYGMYIEPFDLRLSTVKIAAPEVSASRPIRIVQLSDIHVERITPREREMIYQVQALQPDLILLTGDYLNIDYVGDPLTRRDARQVLEQLSAPYGVYAVTGTTAVDQPDAVAEVFAGLPIHLLHDETAHVEVAGASLDLVGIAVSRREDNAATLSMLMKHLPANAFSILLFHTPDLAEAASTAGVDLYLAGHTHGGQIRLPLWGAIVTLSAYGKRFESGLYTLGETRLYVSRGIGMEGLRLPRARFLAPPEIVLIELEPSATATTPQVEQATTP